MSRITRVSLAFVILTASALSAQTTSTPALLKGIGVEMAVTSHAQPMPEADAAAAWIVSVTADGSVYFGIDPVPATKLVEALTRRPRDPDQKLYIKADARAPFGAVESVLEGAREAQFEAPVLLTSQPEAVTTGRVAPKGLEVWASAPKNQDSPLLQLARSGRPMPAVKINHQSIAASVLQSTLDHLMKAREDKTIVLKAEGQLLFSQVVHVIDLCHQAGAKVVVAHP